MLVSDTVPAWLWERKSCDPPAVLSTRLPKEQVCHVFEGLWVSLPVKSPEGLPSTYLQRPWFLNLLKCLLMVSPVPSASFQ